MQAQGHAVGRWRIRRVLKAHGLRAQQPRSFVPRTTDSDPAVRAAPNRLLGQPAPTAPNRVWVGDITYLPRQGGGWLYLAVWLDRCSRKVVGWDVRETMPVDLVSEALRRALAGPRPGLLSTPTKAASTRPSALSSCLPAVGRCKAIAGWATATITPTPNRFGAASRPNCSMAAAFSAWPKLGSKSATTSPITMPNAGTPPSDTTRPTTSKLILKPRSNYFQLS